MRVTISMDKISLQKVLSKMQASSLVANDVRNLLDDAGKLGVQRIRTAGPLGKTGQLREKAEHKVHDAPIPRYVVVKTTATAPWSRRAGGISYPAVLAASEKYGHKDWMKKKVTRHVRAFLRSRIRSLAASIERRWGLF